VTEQFQLFLSSDNVYQFIDLFSTYDNHTGLSKSACSDQGHPLSAKQRVHSFVEYLGERERELHELAARQQRRLGQTLQLQQLEAECGQLLGFVANVEASLCSQLRLARGLDEAELARREHETFRANVERVAASVGGMQAKVRARQSN
jgi:hypothetical protein